MSPFQKLIIASVIFIAIFNFEQSIASFIYTFLLFRLGDDEGGPNGGEVDAVRYARSLHREIIWPLCDLFTSLALLYLFYCQGIKATQQKKPK